MSNTVIAVLVAVLVLYLLRNIGKIPGTEARRLVSEGALLVDVRTEEEFRADHLKGAKSIPLQELADRLDELGAKDTELVLYCRSGARSASARRMLQAQGFKRVHNLGAMGRWGG